jgi:shikimate dehydrogenase
MSANTKFGLLGHPLGHSFSRQFHNDRFARLGIDAVYENFDLDDIAKLPSVLANEPDLRGLNVTIPYKQDVMQFLDELDPLAERIGAVNVVKIEPSADKNTRVAGVRLKGYNSDIVGFRDSLRPMLHGGERAALVLGTGGASKAIFVALRDLGIEPVYVSRTAAPGRLTYSDLTADVMASHLVIVNCTPLGMFPKVDACPDIPYELLTPSHICFDCVYNPAETLFMKRAAEHGAQVKCGYEMLVGQAIESYRIWTE